MRLAIDLQGIQSEGSRKRGIGRYSIEIVKNIVKEADNDEIILVANASLADLRFLFKDQLKLENVRYYEWFSPCPLDYLSKKNITFSIGLYLRSYAFSLIKPDFILLTSVFEGFSDNCFTEFDNDFITSKVGSIFYDLIPLINSNLYLDNNPDFAEFYKSKISQLKSLDLLFAISRSSAAEAAKYLNYNSKNIYNISFSYKY